MTQSGAISMRNSSRNIRQAPNGYKRQVLKKASELVSCLWQVAKKDVKSALEKLRKKNLPIPERSLQASVSKCWFVLAGLN